MARLINFCHLTRLEKRFFLKAIYLLFHYRLMLSVSSLPRLLSRLEQRGAAHVLAGAPQLTSTRMAQLINDASRLVPFSTCLSNTLAGYVLFAESGYSTTIHVGVAKDPQAGLTAHAWLSFDGAIVIGHVADIEKYKELPELKLGSERKSSSM